MKLEKPPLGVCERAASEAPPGFLGSALITQDSQGFFPVTGLVQCHLTHVKVCQKVALQHTGN